MVQQIRQSWPQVRIILRADSGFCREPCMSWCEANGVDYVFGFARNERLRHIIEPQMQQAAALHRQTSQAARVFTEFAYQTNTSWSRPRRVVAKAEQIEGKENPRYLVTSLEPDNWPAQKLYQELYCARGDMGVSRKGHIYQLVRDQPGLKDSSLVAGEASWRESKAAEPSDNRLERSVRNAPGCNVQ